MEPTPQNVLRVKVAELCGWRYLNLAGHSKGNEWWFASPSEQAKYLPEVIHDWKPDDARFNVIGGMWSLPDYCRDLNACAEFEKTLCKTDWDQNGLSSVARYELNLGLICSAENTALWRATSEQRCRAFVATMEGAANPAPAQLKT